MQGKRRYGWLSGAALFFFGLFLWGLPQGAQAKSVNEQILEILLNSKMVTPEKYQELKKQAEAEDAELQRLRALEKKVQEEKAPAGNAKVDFNKGFTMESADGESKLKLSGRLHADYRWFLNDHPSNDEVKSPLPSQYCGSHRQTPERDQWQATDGRCEHATG